MLLIRYDNLFFPSMIMGSGFMIAAFLACVEWTCQYFSKRTTLIQHDYLADIAAGGVAKPPKDLFQSKEYMFR